MTRDPVVALFCGSRGWSDREAIRRDLRALPDLSVVIEGGAQGADRIARFEATQLGLHVATMPALWSLYGKAAGPRRNAAMLKLRPDVVYAFNLGTPGTDVMVKLSRLAGVEVIERQP